MADLSTLLTLSVLHSAHSVQSTTILLLSILNRVPKYNLELEKDLHRDRDIVAQMDRDRETERW